MTTPASEALKPAAAQAAPPAAEAEEAPLPPLDPDAEVGEQIKRAQETVKRAERKAKKQQSKAEPKGAKPTASEPAAEPTPSPEEPAEEAAPGLDTPSAATLAKARQLAEKGDLDGACKLAFGKPAAAFNLNSARWAEWRKTQEKATKAAKDQEQRLVHAAAKLEQTYGKYVKAEKLWAAEDYEGALSAAWGVDINAFQKKALAKYHGKNPEVEQLRREMAEEREAIRKEREELKRHQQEQAEQQQHAANSRAIAQNLQQSNDPQLAALAKKPRFVQRVYTEFLQRVDAGEPPSMVLVAACAEEIRDGLLGEFGDVFVPRPHPGGTIPESPNQAGKKPVRPGAAEAAPSTLSQRGASEASSPAQSAELPTEEEELELIRKYTEKFKHAS